ncbi:MAG: response regulator transcription factor [Dehalococcoidia bacterium]|nr:response regulator transcription factor [Dehalococcoidia bacterium]
MITSEPADLEPGLPQSQQYVDTATIVGAYGQPRMDQPASSSDGDNQWAASGPRQADQSICLIVRSRPYDQAAVLTAVLRRGFAPVETGLESLEAVLSTVSPQVVIAVADPSRAPDRAMIRRVASTGAFVLFLAPSHEYFPLGLAAGADACLEDAAVESALAAQLSSIQRRAVMHRQAESVGILPLAEGLGLDLDAHRIVAPGKTVYLTPFEFALMEALGRNIGRIISAGDIVRAARGPEATDASAASTVKVYVRRLRRKLEEAGIDPQLITTVRGAGYMIDRTT